MKHDWQNSGKLSVYSQTDCWTDGLQLRREVWLKYIYIIVFVNKSSWGLIQFLCATYNLIIVHDTPIREIDIW